MRRIHVVRLFAAVILLSGAGPSVAQRAAPIAADRPGLGDGSALMGARQVQVEAGYAYSSVGAVRRHALGAVLVRYGLGDRVEVRGLLNSYVVQPRPEEASGFEDAGIGLKIAVAPGDGRPLGVPSLTLVLTAMLPTGTAPFGEDDVRSGIKLASDWALTSAQALSLNLSYARQPGPDAVDLTASIGTSVPGTDGIGAFVGYGGSFPAGEVGDPVHYMEAGLTYLPDLDTQLDINGGLGLNGITPDFYIGFGVARRL